MRRGCKGGGVEEGYDAARRSTFLVSFGFLKTGPIRLSTYQGGWDPKKRLGVTAWCQIRGASWKLSKVEGGER